MTEADIEIKAKAYVQKFTSNDATAHELLHRECGYAAGLAEGNETIELQQRQIEIFRKKIVELLVMNEVPYTAEQAIKDLNAKGLYYVQQRLYTTIKTT